MQVTRTFCNGIEVSETQGPVIIEPTGRYLKNGIVDQCDLSNFTGKGIAAKPKGIKRGYSEVVVTNEGKRRIGWVHWGHNIILWDIKKLRNK